MIYVLLQNVLNVALVGSIMIRHDRGGLFFGLIIPHGLLELTAVFVAAGVGLRLFWAWVAPGDRTRSQSLAAEGRTAGGVVMGLAVVLLVSGIIEAFVTPSPLPTWARDRHRRRSPSSRSWPTSSSSAAGPPAPAGPATSTRSLLEDGAVTAA